MPFTGMRQRSTSSPRMQVTKGAIAKSSRRLPGAAFLKPASRWGSSRSMRSGFSQTGISPSATSALVSMPFGPIEAVKIGRSLRPWRMLFSGLPRPVAPGPV